MFSKGLSVDMRTPSDPSTALPQPRKRNREGGRWIGPRRLVCRSKLEEMGFVIRHWDFGIISWEVGQLQVLTMEVGGGTEMPVNVN